MEQFQGVPGASQASFDTLNTQINKYESNYQKVEFSHSTPTGKNNNDIIFYDGNNTGISFRLAKEGNDWYLYAGESTNGTWALKAYLKLTNIG